MSLFVVLGASGYAGAAVVKALTEKAPSAKVYAGVRDPASEKAKPLAVTANVVLFAFDMGKPDTFANVPKNADGVYVNTPGHADRTKLTIAGIDAAVQAQVLHFVD